MIYKYFILSFLFLCTCSAQKSLEGTPCTRDGYNGTCVDMHKCLSLVLDLKEKKNPQICGFDGKTPIICCTDCKESYVANISLVVFNKHASLMFKDGTKSRDACVDYIDQLPYDCKWHVTSELFKNWDSKSKCHRIGVTALAPSGGEDAKRGEFPFMALLGYGPEVDTAQWLCGGSIISNKFILTAGHCISSVQLGPVKYAGLGILKRSDPIDLWQIYNIKNIIAHPSYKSPSKYNDIALLETEETIKFSRDVLPLCIIRDRPDPRYEHAFALGWGSLGPRKPVADTLQKVKVKRFTDEECSTIYEPHRLLPDGFDPKTQLCYGDKDVTEPGLSKDTCGGDSGGPLAYTGGVSYCATTITGVTSYGIECGFQGGAGMYTKVEQYIPWIESVVWP